MLIPNKTYHIYNRANGDVNLFRNDENYRFFLDKYFRYINPVADTFAYILMPSHFHMMIRVKDFIEIESNVSSNSNIPIEKYASHQFSKLFNSYSKSFNKVYDRNGSLFQRPFKYKLVEDSAYFTQLVLYIHNNPVKHGFVDSIYDWRFSSIHQYFSEADRRISSKEVIDWFGNIEDFRKMHENIQTQESEFD